MTVTSQPSGKTLPRPTVVRRRLRARLRAAIAAAALLVIAAPLASTPAFAVEQPAPLSATPTPTPDVPPGETVFTLSPVANGTVRPGEGLAVSVTLQNGTDAVTAAATVTLSLGGAPLGDRAALGAWLAGDGSGETMSPVGSTSLAPILPGGEQVNGIVIEPGDPALAGRAPGVYPLSATYDSPAGPVTSTSVMIVPAEGGAEVGIGVVVPITAGPSSAGLLTSAELTVLTSPAGSLTNQLDAVEGTPAILAVDPAIPAAIRVLGSSAPASATEWLARLEALANSRFALQFGDADVAAQLEAGLPRPLRPLSLKAYIDPINLVTAATATPEPSASPEPEGPVYPSVDELTAIGGARAGVFWPGTGTATPAVVASLGDVVVDDRDSLTLVPSTSTRAGAGGQTVPGRAVAGDADLLVYDADVSRELHAASVTEETALRGAPLTAAAAFLAFAVAETGGDPVVVTIDRDQDRSRVAMRTAITSASQAPGVTPVTLGGVAARLPASVEIADAADEEVRAGAASVLVAEEEQLARFATILDDTVLLTGPERAEILQLLGLAWLPDPVGWQTAVDLHRAGTVTTLDSVGILPPSPINLFSAGAPIPIWVRNDLPYPVNVVLYATPDDLRLDVAKATDVTAGAASNTRVQVPVQARVGNGEVSVQLQLRSRTLEPIGAPQVVDVNVRADWEGVGIVVLSVLVAGFLLLGLVRTVLRLRARRSRRAQTTDSEADGEAAGDGERGGEERAPADRADAGPTEPDAGPTHAPAVSDDAGEDAR
ncbi:hypothetical protein SAMN04487846_0198 [Microbacterium sp. cf046]|uniref:DUF6049 family protein n=1 Tax=Microbacterium sp. cf046 TaxID=1761803 RepID=UPI0008E49575|nr:DUF6049 family protein [Microbacterium sp. cf046]SFR87853.1 hypothetical protein SAMN04487846_0198 [Microbacterium sp. cf046]